MDYRMFSSIPGLYPQDATSTTPIMTIKHVSRYYNVPENHCFVHFPFWFWIIPFGLPLAWLYFSWKYCPCLCSHLLVITASQYLSSDTLDSCAAFWLISPQTLFLPRSPLLNPVVFSEFPSYCALVGTDPVETTLSLLIHFFHLLLDTYPLAFLSPQIWSFSVSFTDSSSPLRHLNIGESHGSTFGPLLFPWQPHPIRV